MRRVRKFLARMLLTALATSTAMAQPTCDKPVYLTFDTGHMGVAPLIAETLKRHNARVTFFLASEPTKTGGTTLDETWAPWWRERVAEGHDFGSHTWDHDVFLEDILDAEGKVVRFKVRTQAGVQPPVVRELTPEQYCSNLKKVGERFTAMTGKPLSPLFRAPAGRTSAAVGSNAILPPEVLRFRNEKCSFATTSASSQRFECFFFLSVFRFLRTATADPER